MQTLVRNSPWRGEMAPHYGREIIWPGPRVMTMADWDLLQRSPAFYARKFDAAVDDQIAPALARAIASPASVPARTSGRTDALARAEQAA